MQIQLESILQNNSQKKTSLLLHACCAPCSSAVLERLASYFETTIFYYNPNIHPQSEYIRRRDELIKFVCAFPFAKDVRLFIPPYNPQEYFAATKTRQEVALQSEPEQGERCYRCYRFRMEKAFAYAAENGFDYATTTLSISPHKDAQKINAIGAELEQKNGNSPKFLYADFKKKNGYKRSLELSCEYNLYRQDYCGCVFSQKIH